MRTLNLLGLGLQCVGAILISLQVWLPSVYHGQKGFLLTTGTVTDVKGRWPRWVQLGLFLYLVGYIPLFLAVWRDP